MLLEAEDGVIDAEIIVNLSANDAVCNVAVAEDADVTVLCTTCKTLPNEPDILVPAIAALALISALTIVPSVIPSDCIFVSGILKFF
jgi:hypothetical protein